MTRDYIQQRLSMAASVTSHETLFRHPEGFLPKPAAVLVPLVNRSEGVSVLLTQRTAHLSAHAGQISFPGGRVESFDRDAIDTALRETQEEIGLERHHVEPLGLLGEYDIPTGFRVTPVVGWVEPPFALAPDPAEVAAVFEVPLSFIVNRDNYRQHAVMRDGKALRYFVMTYSERTIWGATAGMLYALSLKLGVSSFTDPG